MWDRRGVWRACVAPHTLRRRVRAGVAPHGAPHFAPPCARVPAVRLPREGGGSAAAHRQLVLTTRISCRLGAAAATTAR